MFVDKSLPSEASNNRSMQNGSAEEGSVIPVVGVVLNGVRVSLQDPDAEAKIAAELEKLAAAEKAK